jgi:hypothetical protein
LVPTVKVAGQEITGLTSSIIVMILDTKATVLSQESVAIQVSVTVPLQAVGATEKVEGLEVPEIKQPPVNPLLNERVLGAGKIPKATVIAAGAVIVGNAAGLTVIVLETVANALPQESVAVQVSVTGPPQAPGIAEKVEGLEVPEIKQPPVNSLLNEIVLGAGIEPQATVIGPGAVMAGNAAGLTVIILDTDAIVLPSISVAVHVSVTGPPQAPGTAVKVEGFEIPLIKQLPDNPLV